MAKRVSEIAVEHQPPDSPRSARLHQQAIVATQQLLTEGGYGAATIDAIAARAGISKVTLYNHWPSRSAIIANSFGLMMIDALPIPDTGDFTQDLTIYLKSIVRFYRSDLGSVFAQLLASCVQDPVTSVYFNKYFLDERRDTFSAIWRRAVLRDEVDESVDIDDMIDMFFGPLVYRLITGHTELTESSVDGLIRAALGGLGK
ncbi:MAG: TetR/AcrR family transcriptional regulator [Nocardia sp.]|uniref:TetR/AcrR family transcriptional regulator n=1 Tax=Nocardia sp. TaxID=1821 RepID=UPI00260D9D6F|nr:TetR/AcrR family transcriptional regulator [Nocardia sp.]MCU1644978.1 TetR/AcrR family transcriptional regulator [Nocardia sp.]